MAAAAHTKGGYGGVPQSVGREFNSADRGTVMLSKGMKPQTAQYATGGPVLGRKREFLKEDVEFREQDEGKPDTDDDYEKGKAKTKVPPNTKKVIK
jgi:hypothetical protein